MADKNVDKENADKAWIYTNKAVRARLNLYKMMVGISDDSVLNQSAAITALLDNAGVPAPGVQFAGASVEACHQ